MPELSLSSQQGAFPFAAVGVMTFTRRTKRPAPVPWTTSERVAAIQRTWASMVPQSLVVVRFVLQCQSAAQRRDPWVVCSSHEEEHPKALQWFQHALVALPNTPWICHSDDDTYVNLRVLLHDLRQIQPAQSEAYGQLMLGNFNWDDVGAQVPALEQFSDPSTIHDSSSRESRRLLRRKKVYPFLQGGFYALSRDLIALLLPRARSLLEAERERMRRLRIGEDVFIFYALHEALAAANRSMSLRHLTWTRSHWLPKRPERGIFALGWVYPSNASTVVHWIKHRPSDMELVHNVSGGAVVGAFAPFRFVWSAAHRRLEHAAWHQLARWSIYRKCCWIYGCHAPYRGGDIKLFLAQSADLSWTALRAISRDAPFSERERLGGEGFPTGHPAFSPLFPNVATRR